MTATARARLRRGRSLRFRLTALVAGLFAVALIGAAALTRSYLRSELESDARDTATSILDDYLGPTASARPSIDPEEITRILYFDDQGDSISVPEVDRLIVSELQAATAPIEVSPVPGGGGPLLEVDADGDGDGDGATLLPGLGPASGVIVSEEIPRDADASATAVVDAFAIELFRDPGPLRDITVDGAIAVGRDVLLGDEAVTVVVAAPTGTIDDSIAAITGVGAVAIPVLTALVAAITWFVTARTLRPVEAIRRQVAQTDPSRLDRHVPRPGGGDEIDRLAGTMNEMLDRLHAASQQQRRFISDASHELRSPITATIATVEATSSDEAGERWPELSATITSEQHRLRQLVDDLLLLAELDERPVETSAASEIDLDEIVLDEAERPRRLPVHAHIDAPQRVPGNRRLLARALGNLIDNAARHAGSNVDVTVDRLDESHAVIRVDDDGPGIAPENRESILQRFARLDEARRRHEGGAGLGLAIVHEIVRQHAGTLVIGDSPTGGARFEIVLPVDRTAD